MYDVAGNLVSVDRSLDSCIPSLSKKSIDLNMGMLNEVSVEPIINEYFEMKVNNTKLTKGKYCAYDYECDEKQTRYELKSRRIPSNRYDSVFLSTRKIEKGWVEGYRLILLFLFTDGLFYCEYDPYVFKKYSKTTLSVYRDGRREDDKVFNIPICSLKKIIL
jgi:hypothetical protein